MRTEGVKEGRSHSLTTLRNHGLDFSPLDHQCPPQTQDWKYLMGNRDRQYMPQFRDHQYSMGIRDHPYSHGRKNKELHLPLHLVSDLGRGVASIEVERSRRDSNGEDIIRRQEYDWPLDQDREGQFYEPSEFKVTVEGRENYDRILDHDKGEQFHKPLKYYEPGERLGYDNEPLDQDREGELRKLSEYNESFGRWEYDRRSNQDRDAMFPKLSEFKETLSQKEAPSMRFKSMLTVVPGDKNYPSSSAMKPINDYGIGGSRVTTERGYHGNKLSYLGQHESVPQKPMPIKHGRLTTFSSFRAGIDLPKTSANMNGDFSLPSDNITRGCRKDENLNLRGLPVRSEKLSPREIYMEKDDSLFNSHISAQHIMSVPHSKASPMVSLGFDNYCVDGLYNDEVTLPSSGFIRCGGLHIDDDDYGQAKPHASSSSSGGWPKNKMNYTDYKVEDCSRPELDNSDRCMLPDNYYESYDNVQEEFARDKDQYYSFEGRQKPVHVDASIIPYENGREEEVSAPRGYYPALEENIYQGSMHYGKDYIYANKKMEDSPLIDSDFDWYRNYGNSRKRERLGKLHKKPTFKRTAPVDKKSFSRQLGNESPSNRKHSGAFSPLPEKNEHWLPSFSRKSAFSRLNEHPIYESDMSLSPHSSKTKNKQIAWSQNPAFRDTMKLPRIEKSHPISVGKLKANKYNKECIIKIRCDESPVLNDMSPVVVDSFTKTEPPEGSEDFRHMVHNAFLKFVKQMNENPVQLKKYTRQGRGGNLKCNICGSDSEEFENLQCLAMHGVVCSKSGLKSAHLGFHKALCLLNGWKCAVSHNSSWVCESLSDAEASSLKEDLIIWPPVVIVHYPSTQNTDNDLTPLIVANKEALDAKLTENGFKGESWKVSSGKAGNEEVMMVNFSGTLSGLQEAVGLHEFFVKRKHGRSELLSFKMTGDAFFGYLGLAGDLEKLVFPTKKRCVVKSKKDIRAIANAPLKSHTPNECK